MQVVLHAGAHFTDDDKLLKCLSKNRDVLAERGVSLPRPRSYRSRLRDLIHTARDTPIGEATRATLLTDILEIDSPDRMVLSNSNLFSVPRLAVRGDQLYQGASEKLRSLCELFHNDEIELFLAIRNPATFLPALLDGSPVETIEELTAGSTPLALRWSELIHRIRTDLPHVALTVWCNEDTPLIWEQVVRELAGVDPTTTLLGADDLLVEIMSPEGIERFNNYLKAHPGMTEVQKRRVIAAFLDKFALDDELEEELDLPGWTEEYIDAITDAYDEDLFVIERIPGVNLISP